MASSIRASLAATHKVLRLDDGLQLSVFASLLESVPDMRRGTYEIARRGLDVIRNILDRVLGADHEDVVDRNLRNNKY